MGKQLIIGMIFLQSVFHLVPWCVCSSKTSLPLGKLTGAIWSDPTSHDGSLKGLRKLQFRQAVEA